MCIGVSYCSSALPIQILRWYLSDKAVIFIFMLYITYISDFYFFYAFLYIYIKGLQKRYPDRVIHDIMLYLFPHLIGYVVFVLQL